MPNILIADDEPAIAKLCSRLLNDAGHATTSVANGAEALRALEITAYDLVLADIRMPVLDGISLALKVEQAFPRVRFLLMTGHADERARADGMSSLVTGILSKPFDKTELIAAVDAALAD